jgi:hypothetical protein
MVHWAYTSLVVYSSGTYNIYIWIRILRSAHFTDCSTDLRTKKFLHVKTLKTKGQNKKRGGKKLRKKEDDFFMPSAR